MRLATLAMGTRFELVLPGTDRWRLQAAGEAAIEQIEAAHRTFSRFDPDSLLGHLVRCGGSVPVDQPTWQFLVTMTEITAASDGAFDPCHSGGQVTLDPPTRSVVLVGSGIPDFGACAKGFAVDRAVTTLRESGITSAFVHGGTSSGFGLGTPPSGPGWRVALGDDARAPVVSLRDQGFSVSATIVDRGRGPRPHVVRPGSGQSVLAARKTAVIGPSAAAADGWSTAAIVTGTRPGALGPEYRCWIQGGDGPWTERFGEPV